MNIKQQIFLDSFIAKPIAFSLNFIVRALGQILSINHDLKREYQTIAVCKFKGMGSIIQATPMLAAIKVQHPNSKLVFISTKSNRSILEKIDHIDTIITIDESSLINFITSNISALYQLIKKRPGVYFDLEIYSDFSTLFTLFSLSTNRVGFYLRSSSFRMGIYTHMMFFNPKVPISNVYLQMSKLIGCNDEHQELYPLKKSIQKPFSHSRKYLVINPNSSDLRLERRWDSNNFIQIIRKTLNEFSDYNIFLIGSKDEQEYTESISTIINDPRLISTAGKTSISEVIALIDSAEIMITNDTGPMHLAFALKKEVICLFGPCSPDQYGRSNNAHVIYKNTYCSPCVHDFEIAPCNGNNICMQLIGVEEVNENIASLLNTSKVQKSTLIKPIIYQTDQDILGIVQR